MYGVRWQPQGDTDFLAAIIDYIPPKGQQTVRY
jgi:hypothetical protein